MTLMGIGDEAGAPIDAQIKATKELGWKHIEMRAIEVPGFPKGNFHDIPAEAFDMAVDKLQKAGLSVYCFGSAVMNWAKKVEDPFDVTLAEVKRAIPRMQKLGTKFVRIMSFKPEGRRRGNAAGSVRARARSDEDVSRCRHPARARELHELRRHELAARAGVAGQMPRLKWVFDTGNPIFNLDRRGPKPWQRQDPWEFWTHVRDHTAHIHVKDATWNAGEERR